MMVAWMDRGVGGRAEEDEQSFSFAVISVNYAQSGSHLEELQNKFNLR